MIVRRIAIIRNALLVLLGGILPGSPGDALAQDGPATKQSESTPPRSERGRTPGTQRDGRPARQNLGGALNEAFPPLPGPNPFRQRPEDAGPLAPGEDRELLEFAQAHMPRLHERLKIVRNREPALLTKRIADAAPRMRMLRRLFRDHPALAARVVAHVDKVELLRRAERLWADAGDNRARKQRVENEARRLLADLAQIEHELAAARAREIDENRDRMVESEVGRLTKRDADLAGEPREVRFFVDAHHAAEDEISRAGTLDDLRDLVWVALDEQFELLRERAEILEKNRRQIVDRRFNSFVQQASGEKKTPNAGVPTSRP